LQFVHTEDEKAVSKRYLTENQLVGALSKGCSTVSDLNSIAKVLDLSSYVCTSDSFKENYRLLAKCIYNECNLSLAMVEGLHRVFAIRNILEGRLCDVSEEPFTKNVFIQTKVKVRLHILDTFDAENVKRFQGLSLFIMKVKKSSLERTVFDEITQICNEMVQENQIIDLQKTKCLEQAGKHDSESGNDMYQQRLYIYNTILDFALNEKKSSVLYDMQNDHINQVLNRQLIQNKHAYLGIDPSIDLDSVDVFKIVKTVVLHNMKDKAKEFVVLCTKDSMRNIDSLTKPLCQEIRVIMTYILLSSISMEKINRAVRVFCPSVKFQYEQSKSNVQVLHTMFRLVMVVQAITDNFRKCIRLPAVDVYATKLNQLLSMNLFDDILNKLEEIGHHPVLPSKYVDVLSESEESSSSESIFLQLLKQWQINSIKLMSSQNDFATNVWKDILVSVLKGNTFSKTDVRLGKFSGSFDDICIPEVLLFSTYFSSIGCEEETSKSACDDDRNKALLDEETIKPAGVEESNNVACPEETNKVEFVHELSNAFAGEANKTSSVSISNELCDEDSFNELADDDEVESHTEEMLTDKEASTPKRNKQPRQRRSSKKRHEPDDELDVVSKQKAPKVSKKVFRVSDEVFEIYRTVQTKQSMKLPVAYDMTAIKNAWMETARQIQSPDDLLNLWGIHKKILFEYYSTSSSPSPSHSEK